MATTRARAKDRESVTAMCDRLNAQIEDLRDDRLAWQQSAPTSPTVPRTWLWLSLGINGMVGVGAIAFWLSMRHLN
jgi:hypothetical protein